MDSRSTSIEGSVPISLVPAAQNAVVKSKDNPRGSLELSYSDASISPSPIPRKFITNWRHACSRTRDRTKELLRKWRTVPKDDNGYSDQQGITRELERPGWSVHVWTTWVGRFPSTESLSTIANDYKDISSEALAPIQRDKLLHFFTYLLDHDKNGCICIKDFELLTERLRRFADWSRNGPEYLRLLEIQRGLVNAIFMSKRDENDDEKRVDLDDWLCWWARLLVPPNGTSYSDLPLWIKAVPRVLFLAINSSGNGMISKDELAAFYGSVVGLDSKRIDTCLNVAYESMTSNGDHPLGWVQYQLVFANFLFARGPFGPGEHLLGMTDSCILRDNSIPFPIDYSAMNTPIDKLEVYNPHCTTNRRSVVV